MKYNINTDNLNLNVNKGSVIIKKDNNLNSYLSFDDKFKSYVSITEKNGKIDVKVDDSFKKQ